MAFMDLDRGCIIFRSFRIRDLGFGIMDVMRVT